MTSNQQTPLEKLQMEKLRLTKACETQEHKLNEHFAYIQENAGSLLLSGLSSILFSSSPNKGKGKSQDSSATDNKESVATPINIGSLPCCGTLPNQLSPLGESNKSVNGSQTNYSKRKFPPKQKRARQCPDKHSPNYGKSTNPTINFC